MINPWVILAVVLAIMGSFAAGYGKGRTDGTAKCEVRVTKMLKDSQDRKDKEATTANKAADKVEKGNAKAKVIYREIVKEVDRIVDRPVYRNVCFDPDGVRSANAALAGAPATPGKPGSTLP